jgi:hypothetical protein
MKKARDSNLMALLSLAALALVLTPGFASADGNHGLGNFTLASETHWGKAVLPPGNYSFEIDLTNDLITVRGQKQTVMVLAQVHDTDTQLKLSSLVLVSRGGKRIVRALRLADQKVVVLYPVPQRNREELVQEPTIIESVPVTINGK